MNIVKHKNTRKMTTLISKGTVYKVGFANNTVKKIYDRLWVKTGYGEGADYILRNNKTEEEIIEWLKKAPGFTLEKDCVLGLIK